MKYFKTKVERESDEESDEEFEFECYENTEPIKMGDAYIFFIWGISDVQICDSEIIEKEISRNDRVHDTTKAMDLITGFWKKCYKIKSTNFDLNNTH